MFYLEREDWIWVHDSLSREEVIRVKRAEKQDLDGEQIRGDSVSTGQRRETMKNLVFLRAKRGGRKAPLFRLTLSYSLS